MAEGANNGHLSLKATLLINRNVTLLCIGANECSCRNNLKRDTVMAVVGGLLSGILLDYVLCKTYRQLEKLPEYAKGDRKMRNVSYLNVYKSVHCSDVNRTNRTGMQRWRVPSQWPWSRDATDQFPLQSNTLASPLNLTVQSNTQPDNHKAPSNPPWLSDLCHISAALVVATVLFCFPIKLRLFD